MARDNSWVYFSDYLKQPLEEYIADNFTKVKLFRSEERLGLIRARMAGAKHATGDVSWCFFVTYFLFERLAKDLLQFYISE